MKKPLVSVVIATYNSAPTLGLVLAALRRQAYPQSLIEILVIDGGSTDATLSIAKKYRAKIYKNPRVEFNNAKFIGINKAKSNFILFLDSDEVLENPADLALRVPFMAAHKDIPFVLSGGYIDPPGFPMVNKYINEFGDPFSFFLYRLSKNFRHFANDMRALYPIANEDRQFVIFSFSRVRRLPIIEISAGGTLANMQLVKKHFPAAFKTVGLINHGFYSLVPKYPKVAILKSSSISHYSSSTLGRYLKKIAWRIRSNIHYSSSLGVSGFGGRSQYLSPWRKYLFIPYSLLVLPALYDSISLAWSRRNLGYLLHLFLSIYASSLIICHYILKLARVRPQLTSYGGTAKI